jgi:hypothetical protein
VDLDELVDRHDQLLAELRDGTPQSAGRLFEERSLSSGGELLGEAPLQVALDGYEVESRGGPFAQLGAR